MPRLSHLAPLACAVALFAACGGTDADDTADTAGMADTMGVGMQTPMPAPAALSLANVAGRWNVRAVPESGDTTPTTFVLTATADSTGWTTTFPDRAPLATRVVAVGGDSVVTEVGPYESVRRRGVQVRTRSVVRMDADRLTGTAVARYQTTGADSVLRLRLEGTRAP